MLRSRRPASRPAPRTDSTPTLRLPITALATVIALTGFNSEALSVSSHQPGGNGTTYLDRSTWIDANQIEMVTTNEGSIGYDLIQGAPGLVYPTGGVNTCLYAAGLWIGAVVDGEPHVTVAEYGFEFTPGRIEEDGSWDEDIYDPRWRTYKIERGDTPGSNPDYDEWPVDDGAPVDENGAPRHLGRQTLFSVYHDANPDAHTNDAGATQPLGADVQQTIFALDNPGAANDIVFVQWKIVNDGEEAWRDAYVSCWLDPDLGGAGDDYVGCDPDQSLGYCYNATNDDLLYGATPPCLGALLVRVRSFLTGRRRMVSGRGSA
ncbi:MAG: hypothetical protein R3E97_23280 [Candidatus Eisenbacteria bacterium]